MNIYTVAIDVAAPSLMKASDAIFLMIKTEATKSTVSECMKMPGSIAIDLDSLRVLPRQASDENPHGKKKEQAQDLPTNCREISVAEAVEIAKCGAAGRLVIGDDGFVVRQSIHWKPEMIHGSDWCVVADGGAYLVIPSSCLSEYRESLRA